MAQGKESPMPSEEVGATSRRVGRKVRLGLAIVAVVAAAGVFHRPLFLGNFGVVDPGKVYRSAQPKGNLEELIEECRPASILNLRGGSRKEGWYTAELEAAERHGIDFYDYPMSAEARPTRKQLLTLIDLMGRARYPLLIHCKQGADRTGLASAVYLMTRRAVPPEEARGALTVFHGHVPLLGTSRLHEPLIEYRDWLAAQGLVHEPSKFRAWVETEYQDPSSSVEPDDLEPGSRWDAMAREQEDGTTVEGGATRTTAKAGSTTR